MITENKFTPFPKLSSIGNTEEWERKTKTIVLKIRRSKPEFVNFQLSFYMTSIFKFPPPKWI